MKKTETYHDEALRIIMRQQAENAQQMEFPEDLADKLMQRIEQKEALQRKALQRKRRWIAVGIAAALALFIHLLKGIYLWLMEKRYKVFIRTNRRFIFSQNIQWYLYWTEREHQMMSVLHL